MLYYSPPDISNDQLLPKKPLAPNCHSAAISVSPQENTVSSRCPGQICSICSYLQQRCLATLEESFCGAGYSRACHLQNTTHTSYIFSSQHFIFLHYFALIALKFTAFSRAALLIIWAAERGERKRKQ